MSYCVNCGVELDSTLVRCPLCNTPVINPATMQYQKKQIPFPYPQKRGQVDTVKRTDLAILISVILIGTAFACGLLNLFVYQSNHWSFYVIGACALLWVLFTPMLIYRKIPIYLTVLIDMASVALYTAIIAYELSGFDWYFYIALPFICILTLLILGFLLFQRKVNNSVLALAVIIFGEIAGISIALELLLHNYFDSSLYISWSAIILTCCMVIDAALITILTRVRLREEVRRRMHF